MRSGPSNGFGHSVAMFCVWIQRRKKTNRRAVLRRFLQCLLRSFALPQANTMLFNHLVAERSPTIGKGRQVDK